METIHPGSGIDRFSGQLSGGSKKARFSCTTAPLLWRCRPRSIGRGERRRDGATEANRQGCPEHASRRWPRCKRARRRNDLRPNQSTGPGSARDCRREGRPHEQNTAAADPANDGERAALKRMALARDYYRIGKIPAMGSLSPLLSITFVIRGYRGWSGSASLIR